MRHRTLGGTLLAVVLALAGCAPPGGAGESSAPSEVPASAGATSPSAEPTPSPSAAPMESEAVAGESATPVPTPDSYEY